MKNQTLIIVLVVIGTIWALAAPLAGEIVAIGAWIYIIWMIRNLTEDEVKNENEPGISIRLRKRIKKLKVTAILSLIAFFAGAILHNLLYGLTMHEEIVFLIIASVGHLLFILATGASLLLFLIGRHKNS